ANVASPQIRNMATLGGNLCLDTRCTYINQSDFWRGALGGCLKADGDVCHVVPGGRNCVAAFSGDTAIALIALEAKIDIVGPTGKRTIPLPELYNANGAYHLNVQPGEILTQVHIPRVPNRRLSYRKWSVRQSIDFPLVNVAIRIDETPDGMIEDLVAVVGVLAARPKVLNKLADRCRGQKLSEDMAAQIGEAVYKKCKPLPNVPYDHVYRREMLRVQAKRAVMNLLPGQEMRVREG
ncbi:MAG: FAD binding domain-containing protein, partial [bacterium]